MSEPLKEDALERFMKVCEQTHYAASEFGYVPHGDTTRIICPVCRNGVFRSFPQGCDPTAKVWAWEYECANCGHKVAIELMQDE